MLSTKSTLEDMFKILANGDPKEFKEAQRMIKRKWTARDSEFKNSWTLVEEYINKFDSIQNTKNKAALISGLSLFYLVFADEHFEFLKNFSLKNLVDNNGHIREAMRHTSDWLYSSLSSRVSPFIYPEGTPLTPKRIEGQKIATAQYLSLIKEVEDLMEKYDDGKEQHLDYIDDMKPSIHKSLQMFWSRLTDNRVYRNILEKRSPVSFEVLIKKKEIETEIGMLLKQAKSDFDFEDIKEVIFNEEGSDSMQEIISFFDTGKNSAPELSTILETITDAWNYFPHRSLGGRSPAEMR